MNNKNILITGGLGYIGTELCKLLSSYNKLLSCHDNGNNIIVIDSVFMPERVAWLRANGIRFYQRSIFDIKDLLENCDICYHLAGITQVPQTIKQSNPVIDKEIHLIGTEGTRYIINHCPKQCKIIFASTQVIFDGLSETVFNIKEDYTPCPTVAYSISKRDSELDLLNSNKKFTIVRFASVYGYNENMRWKILPNLFSKLASQNQDLTVFGADNFKPLVSVKDVSRAISFLSDESYNGETFHCVNENVKVIDIANICKNYNNSININITNDETPNKGFTLSNRKLLDTGFKFSDNLKEEIGNMINLWRNE